MSYKIAVILGSVREARLGTRVAKFIIGQCEDRGWSVELIDPKQINLPLLDKKYDDYESGTAPQKLEMLRDKIVAVDGYLIVTAEYNHSLPPALTNLMDYFFEEYMHKPAGIVSYSDGSFGGTRAAVQARVFVNEIGAITIPRMFPIPTAQKSFDDQGQPLDQKYFDRAKSFLDQFEWYLRALKNARENN